jgi:dipeptidyl aminopeptidase/acylaminoacyl peptidase
MPADWAIKSIKQHRKKLAFHRDGNFIQFDAVPDGGKIVFTRKSVGSPSAE